MAVLFVQWYTGAMLLTDLYVLARLWGASLLAGTAALAGPSAPQLSKGTLWFDKMADCPLGATLFTFAMAFMMLARSFAAVQPLNRWILLNTAVVEFCRLVFFSLLFKVSRDVTAVNTMLLTFMAWNVFVYGYTWYSTMCMLRQGAKQ